MDYSKMTHGEIMTHITSLDAQMRTLVHERRAARLALKVRWNEFQQSVLDADPDAVRAAMAAVPPKA